MAKDAVRTDALPLLNHAKSFMRLHAANTPAHLLTVHFTADGTPGELTELWLGLGSQRWTAKLGDYSLTRFVINGESFDEKHAGILPMRLHMLRNSLFWAAGTIGADAHFRTAPATWNDKPVTCVLVSDRADSSATAARRWDESEYCIDDESGLIQTFSFAPGNYSVYTYTKSQSYHGTPLPDHMITYIAGAMVIDASLRLDEPDGSIVPSTPTAEMIANGKTIGLQDPIRQRIEVSNLSVSADEPVMVNAQVGPTGEVAAAEICASSDPALNAGALEHVKAMRLGGGDFQRQVYVELVYTPRSRTMTATKSSDKLQAPRVPIESYILERSITRPDGVEMVGRKEILARREDGSTVRMNSVGLGENTPFSRDISFIDGRQVTVYESIHAKVTWPARNEAEMSYQRDRAITGPGECDQSNSTLLRHDQMEGQDVDVIQFSAGSNRVTLWSAPKLGCEYLYDKAEAPARDGTFRTDLEVKTTKLVLGEPDPQLFEVAPSLVEMKPSEALRKVWGSLDLPVSADEKAAMLREIDRQGAEMDKQYQPKGN
jgi:hypothetical protein